MSMQIRDKVYYEMYSEISELLFQSYYDYNVYQGIIDSKELIEKIPAECRHVIMHYSELLKDDMGLSLWKIHDNGKDANSINKLERYLNTKYEKTIRYKYSDEVKHLIHTDLCNIRRVRLAHNLQNKGHASVQISNIKKALDETRENLNELCFTNIDDRVTLADYSRMAVLGMDSGFGIRLLIKNSVEYLSKL